MENGTIGFDDFGNPVALESPLVLNEKLQTGVYGSVLVDSLQIHPDKMPKIRVVTNAKSRLIAVSLLWHDADSGKQAIANIFQAIKDEYRWKIYLGRLPLLENLNALKTIGLDKLIIDQHDIDKQIEAKNLEISTIGVKKKQVDKEIVLLNYRIEALNIGRKLIDADIDALGVDIATQNIEKDKTNRLIAQKQLSAHHFKGQIEQINEKIAIYKQEIADLARLIAESNQMITQEQGSPQSSYDELIHLNMAQQQLKYTAGLVDVKVGLENRIIKCENQILNANLKLQNLREAVATLELVRDENIEQAINKIRINISRKELEKGQITNNKTNELKILIEAKLITRDIELNKKIATIKLEIDRLVIEKERSIEQEITAIKSQMAQAQQQIDHISNFKILVPPEASPKPVKPQRLLQSLLIFVFSAIILSLYILIRSDIE